MIRPLAVLFILSAFNLSAAVKIEKIAYKQFATAYRVTNGEVELIVTANVGPRVIRYGFVGGENLFKEMTAEEEKFLTAGQDWRLYGGHRIWAGPELPSYTYSADNKEVDIEIHGNRLRAVAPTDPSGIEKMIEVELAETGTEVQVRHRLTNRGKWPLRFAPWALTMMAKGGVGVAAFPPRGTHPEMLLPTNPLVMWAFTNLADPRWTILEKYIVLHNDPAVGDPEKIGLFNPNTRAAYLLGSDLFVKKYQADPKAEYPDMGASYETFTNEIFLELETLGPIEDVMPGESIDHAETWSLHRNVKIEEWTDAELDRVLGPLFE